MLSGVYTCSTRTYKTLHNRQPTLGEVTLKHYPYLFILEAVESHITLWIELPAAFVMSVMNVNYTNYNVYI